MTRYTAMHIAFKRYKTTNMPTVLVGLRPPHDLKVSSDTRKDMANMATDVSRSSQTESAVPSS